MFSQHFLSYLTTILILLGCSLLLYPTAAQWISQYNQVKVTERYEKTIKFTEPAANIQIKNAEAYNQLLASGADLEKIRTCRCLTKTLKAATYSTKFYHTNSNSILTMAG